MLPNNVVLFPEERIKYPKRVGKIIDSIEDIKHNTANYVGSVLESLMPMILNHLEASNIDVCKESDIKDGAMVVEAIKSLLLKQYKINHPFQMLSEQIFSCDNKGNLTMNSIENLNG